MEGGLGGCVTYCGRKPGLHGKLRCTICTESHVLDLKRLDCYETCSRKAKKNPGCKILYASAHLHPSPSLHTDSLIPKPIFAL